MSLGGMLGGGGAQLLLRLKADASQALGEFDRLDERQRSSGRGMQMAAGVAAAALGTLAVKGVSAFAALDTGMREVFTLMPGMSEQAMGDMTDDVRAFAEEYGITTSEVVPALYDAISAGVPADNVMTFMETAAQTARGGVTDLQTAVGGLTTLVGAYGEDVLDAADASDILFTGMRLGKTTIGEMSDALFQVVPVAAASGITFDQVTSALVALTLQGVPTRVAATNIRGALVELGREGTVAFDAFEAATGQTFPEFITAGGDLGEAMGLLGQYAAENGTTIQNMFGSVEGGMAATVLASETGSAAFGTAMDEMGNRAGATGEAFDTMAGGIGFTFDQIKAKTEGVLLGFGEAMMPTLDALIPQVTNLLGAFTGIVGVLGQVDGLLPGIIASLGALALGLGPVGALVVGIATIGVTLGGGPIAKIDELEGAVTALHDAIASGSDDIGDERQALIDLGFSAEEVDRNIQSMTTSISSSQAIAGSVVGAWSGMAGAVADAAVAQSGLEDSAGPVADAEGELADALGDTAEAASAVLAAEEELADARRKAIDPLFAMVDAEAELITAQDTYNQLLADGQQGTDEYEAAVRDLLGAQGDYDAALFGLAVNQGASIDAIEALGREAGLSEQDIADLIRRIEEYNALAIVDKDTTITLHEVSTGGASGHTYFGGGRQHGGSVPTTGMYTVGEAGPERVILPGGSKVLPYTPGGGGVNLTVNVAGSLLTEQELVGLVEAELVRAAKRGATSAVY